MIDKASRPNAPFQEILVWKFSRFTRKREHGRRLQVHAPAQGRPCHESDPPPRAGRILRQVPLDLPNQDGLCRSMQRAGWLRASVYLYPPLSRSTAHE